VITTLATQVPGFTPGPGWNLIADVQDMLSFAFMRNAFAAGTASAIVAGLIGYFVVLRQSSFAAHAMSHIGFAGAAGAVLLGLSPVLGVAVLSLAVLITWVSLALAYYPPYPVSFYVTSLAFVGYLAARAWTGLARRAGRAQRSALPQRGHRDAEVAARENATVRT